MRTTRVKQALRCRFYPTGAQAAGPSRTFGCVRKVYTMALTLTGTGMSPPSRRAWARSWAPNRSRRRQAAANSWTGHGAWARSPAPVWKEPAPAAPALTRCLPDQGIQVVEVNRPDGTARRTQGKADTLDAQAAVRGGPRQGRRTGHDR